METSSFPRPASNGMKVYLAADHGGFNLKEALKAYLQTQGYEVLDEGAHKLEPTDDYPDFMYPAAQKVAADMDSRGIFFCRSGAGAAIVANKVKGVRAVVGSIMMPTSSLFRAIHSWRNKLEISLLRSWRHRSAAKTAT